MIFKKGVIKMPVLLYRLFKNCLFHYPREESSIFITFDDGPDPTLTPYVLDLLNQYNAKATFFCLGHKARDTKKIINSIAQKGHGLGNHGFYHLNHKRCTKKEYVANIEKASEYITSKLFRPPYGRIGYSTLSEVNKKMQVVFYTIIAKDYDLKYSDDKITRDLLNKIKPGYIIVLHDVAREGRNTLCILRKLLEFIQLNGWMAKRLPGDKI